MSKWGVHMLFEATQMVSRAHTTLHVTLFYLGMFREKIWPIPKKSEIFSKTTKIEGYNTHFRIFPGSELRRHGIPPRGMGGHWKKVMWLGTNMWMSLRSFRESFRFHEKWTNRVFRNFSRQNKWCQAPAPR